jgi:hypothetical protein
MEKTNISQPLMLETNTVCKGESEAKFSYDKNVGKRADDAIAELRSF